MSAEGKRRNQKRDNQTWLAEEKSKWNVNRTWLTKHVGGRGANNVTLFKLTKHGCAAAYLDAQYCFFLLTGMQTWIAMDVNGYTLRRAWELHIYLVDENGHDFDAYEWSWTENDVPKPHAICAPLSVNQESIIGKYLAPFAFFKNNEVGLSRSFCFLCVYLIQVTNFQDIW